MSALHDQQGLENEDQAFDVLQELERQTSDEIRRKRAHDRLSIKAKVVVQPANSGDMLKYRIEGVTGDVSAGGCRVMLPVPIGVGDIFRLTFMDEKLDLPMVFARCMRCSLVREDAFEAGFKFFSKVNIQAPEAAGAGSLLI